MRREGAHIASVRSAAILLEGGQNFFLVSKKGRKVLLWGALC